MEVFKSLLILSMFLFVGHALYEPFSVESWPNDWTPSSDPSYKGKWNACEYSGPYGVMNDSGLVTTSKSCRYAISKIFKNPIHIVSGGKNRLYVQYEVKSHGHVSCGAAYLKIYGDPTFNSSSLNKNTPYKVMFGPNKCNHSSHIKLDINGFDPTEKKFYTMSLSPKLEFNFSDGFTHLYHLFIDPDNATFKILVDGKKVKFGSFFDTSLFEVSGDQLGSNEYPDAPTTTTTANRENGTTQSSPTTTRHRRIDLGMLNAVGFEFWTLDDQIMFDNIVITKDEDEATRIATLWNRKHYLEKKIQSISKMRQSALSILDLFIDHLKYFSTKNTWSTMAIEIIAILALLGLALKVMNKYSTTGRPIHRKGMQKVPNGHNEKNKS